MVDRMHVQVFAHPSESRQSVWSMVMTLDVKEAPAYMVLRQAVKKLAICFLCAHLLRPGEDLIDFDAGERLEVNHGRIRARNKARCTSSCSICFMVHGVELRFVIWVFNCCGGRPCLNTIEPGSAAGKG